MGSKIKYTPEINKCWLRLYAKFNNWIESDETADSITFVKPSMAISIHLPQMKVLTTINHPRWGVNTLERSGIDYDTLKLIFQNPRIHTDKGKHNHK
jgi:hypothetical protein